MIPLIVTAVHSFNFCCSRITYLKASEKNQQFASKRPLGFVADFLYVFVMYQFHIFEHTDLYWCIRAS